MRKHYLNVSVMFLPFLTALTEEDSFSCFFSDPKSQREASFNIKLIKIHSHKPYIMVYV